MRLGKLGAVFLGVSLLASVVLPRYLPAALRPDLFVILTVFLAMRAPREEALPLCWCTGLVSDLLSCGPLGVYALLHMTVALAILRTRASVDPRLAVTYAMFGFLASLMTGAANLGVISLHAERWPRGAMLGVVLTSSLVTGGLAPFCVWALARLGGWPRTARRYRFKWA